MATFTIELRKILDRGIDIGLNSYPIFDESYRPKLNQSITEHFEYREIGFETIDVFINRFAQRMNLIMPVYNRLYETTLMQYNPLTTTKIVTDSEGTGKETGKVESVNTSAGTNKSTTDSTGRNVSSDFPQAMLQDKGQYATAANDSVSKAGASSTATEAGKNDTEQAGEHERASHTTMEGYTMSPADLVLKFRDTIINVDAMIITELEVLFMSIWNNSDEYGNNYRSLYPRDIFLYGGF